MLSLSEAKGVCPAGGSQEGGWEVAGLAYYGRTTDLRPDRGDVQNVVTRAIDTDDDLPQFRFVTIDGMAGEVEPQGLFLPLQALLFLPLLPHPAGKLRVGLRGRCRLGRGKEVDLPGGAALPVLLRQLDCGG